MFDTHSLSANVLGSDNSDLRERLRSIRPYLGRYYELFILLSASGSRCSEILAITPERISAEGGAVIIGKKGSENRYVFDAEVSSYLLKYKANGIAPFMLMNISSANRLLRKHGLMMQKEGRKRMTVSGIFRNEKAKNVRNSSSDESLTARTLGHKSTKSTGYYGK